MNGFFYDSYRLVLSFLLLGVFLGAVYDVFRILRIGRAGNIAVSGKLFDIIRPKHRLFGDERAPVFGKRREALERLLVYFEDILFFLIVAVVEILWFFHTNDGEIRIICLVASAVGFLFYNQSIGRVVLYFARQIVFVLRCILYWILYGIIMPVKQLMRWLFSATSKLFKATVGKLIAGVMKKRQAAYSERRKKELLQMASAGFGVGREREV